MNLTNINKLSKASQLSLLAVVILLGAVFVTVNSALQQQTNSSSHASGTTYASISLRSSTHASNGSAAHLTLTTPTNKVAGDVMIAQVVVHGASTTITAPSGWSLIRKDTTSTSLISALYKHVASGVDSSTYTWKFSTTQYASGGIGDFSNVNTTGPIDVSSGRYNYNTTSMTAPSVTTTTPADELVFFGAVNGSASVTVPSGMTSTWTAATSKTTSYMARVKLTASGSTGTKTAKSSIAVSNVSQLVALKPRATTGPTPTPTKKPTPTPTKTPGGATPTPTQTPGEPTPTNIPGVSPTPNPTDVPSPTPSPVPGDTVLDITVGLQGIGSGGDSSNPNSQGNGQPQRPERQTTVELYDAQNQLVLTKHGVITFDSSSGKFTGLIDLGGNFTTGLYTVKIQSEQYLRGLVPGIQTITAGQTNTLPDVSLITGDANGDNQINIVDYNLLIGCYSDLLPPKDCNPSNKGLTDLDDDGSVNQFDYNLFLRELSNVGGQ